MLLYAVSTIWYAVTTHWVFGTWGIPGAKLKPTCRASPKRGEYAILSDDGASRQDDVIILRLVGLQNIKQLSCSLPQAFCVMDNWWENHCLCPLVLPLNNYIYRGVYQAWGQCAQGSKPLIGIQENYSKPTLMPARMDATPLMT